MNPIVRAAEESRRSAQLPSRPAVALVTSAPPLLTRLQEALERAGYRVVTASLSSFIDTTMLAAFLALHDPAVLVYEVPAGEGGDWAAIAQFLDVVEGQGRPLIVASHCPTGSDAGEPERAVLGVATAGDVTAAIRGVVEVVGGALAKRGGNDRASSEHCARRQRYVRTTPELNEVVEGIGSVHAPAR